MSQSVIQATLSLLKDLWNNNSADLSLETIRFNKKLLRRDDSAEASKYWIVQD